MNLRSKTVRAVACLLLICLIGTLSLSSCSRLVRSISSTEINESGELIVYYSDGSSENLGVVKGEDGAPGIRGEVGKKGADGEKGANGIDGIDGTDGTNGKDGTNGTDGVITIVPDTDTVALAAAKGLRSAVSIYCVFTASGSTTPYASAGSGVIYRLDPATGNALIITNYHVVYDVDSRTQNGISESITLYLYGAEYESLAIEAEYVGGSMYYDIAVLSVTGSEVLKNSDAVAVTVGDSEAACVGSDAIAVGNPKNLGISSSLGIVSVDSEQIKMTAVDEVTTITLRVMRIDTAVNSGNSGGGLYNRAGELIGIVNAKISAEDVENIGYAIPSNLAVAVAENIIDHCLGTATETVMRAMLGITLSVSDSRGEFDAESGYITIVETVFVKEVSAGGAADGLLRADDTVLSVTLGGRTVDVMRQYQVIDRMLDARAGDTVTFTVLRDGTETTVHVPIAADDLIAY